MLPARFLLALLLSRECAHRFFSKRYLGWNRLWVLHRLWGVWGARDLGDCTRDQSIPGNARAGRTRSCCCVLALLFPCQPVARAHTPRAISHLFPCS